MAFRASMIFSVVVTLAACSRESMPSEPIDQHAPYEIINEGQTSAMLRVDWKGEGRDLDTGKSVEVPEKDARRKSFVTINFVSNSPAQWRSNLERRMKSGDLTPGDVHTEPAGGSGMVRAYIVNERHAGEFFFKSGAGPDLSSASYVAACSLPLAVLKGAVQCSTQLDVSSFAVRITFDRAFLWDFDNLSGQAIAAAKHYIAKPSTQHSIESIPHLDLSGSKPSGSGG